MSSANPLRLRENATSSAGKRHAVCSRHRSGHDLVARDAVRCLDARVVDARSRNSRSISRPRAGSSTSPTTSGRSTLATCREALKQREGRGRRTSPPSASPISARPRWCGIARPGRPMHRAIVWQDRRTADICAQAEGRRRRASHRGEDRPDHRSLFLRHQDRLAARSRARRARARRARRARYSAPSTASCCGG